MAHNENAQGEEATATPISSWSKGEKPRERLLRFGPAVLTPAELLALIMGSGTRIDSRCVTAVEVGRYLLNRYGSLRRLSNRDVRDLMQAEGIGQARASQLIAAFELGRRIEAEPPERRTTVSNPEDVARVYTPLMRGLRKEVFRVLLLNTASVVTDDYIVSEGGLASSIVEPRAVFHRAILEQAAGLICVHNHPSGNPEPSRQDIEVTKQLVEGGKVLGIPVHDHVIIAGNSFTSLARRGLM